jgi:SAM-dependent methyltransferase
LSSDLERLIAEAEAQPVTGWDFSWLGDRMQIAPLPWDFSAIVAERARTSPDLLDLGTGGGEWLSSLPYRPPRTIATEAWPPNVPIARARLAPLGIEVVQVEGAPDNLEQVADEQSGRLPFADGSFHLVLSRHEAFVATEVARVVAPGGRFVTQQLSPGSAGFADLLGLDLDDAPLLRLEVVETQVSAAGLAVVAADEGERKVGFADVGALAWYLEAVPWTLPGFSIDSYRSELRRLHEREGPIEVTMYSFWLEAVAR